jgi:hypothetical protein
MKRIVDDSYIKTLKKKTVLIAEANEKKNQTYAGYFLFLLFLPHEEICAFLTFRAPIF